MQAGHVPSEEPPPASIPSAPSAGAEPPPGCSSDPSKSCTHLLNKALEAAVIGRNHYLIAGMHVGRGGRTQLFQLFAIICNYLCENLSMNNAQCLRVALHDVSQPSLRLTPHNGAVFTLFSQMLMVGSRTTRYQSMEQWLSC
jgi:hypothetical protein